MDTVANLREKWAVKWLRSTLYFSKWTRGMIIKIMKVMSLNKVYKD